MKRENLCYPLKQQGSYIAGLGETDQKAKRTFGAACIKLDEPQKIRRFLMMEEEAIEG